MKIDAGVYFWKNQKTFSHPLIRENKILQQQYLPEQLLPSLHRNGMEGCIAVVAEKAEVETRFLSELAQTHPEIKGVTGWLDLYDPRAAEKIREFQQYRSIKSYSIDSRKDLPAADVMELLLENQYWLELSPGPGAFPENLKSLLSENPEFVFILQDCGNPDAKQPPSKAWETGIRDLAKNRNLSCKLSGLFTQGNRKTWKPADFYPFLEIIFDSFGSGRILFASDWPLLLISGMYVQWKSLIEKFMERFPEEDRQKVFGENASAFYRI